MAEGDTPNTEAPPSELPQDRPVQNVVAEFNRKFAAQGNQISQLTQAVSALANSLKPAASPADNGHSVDDDLFARAQQGDKSAFEEWTNRKADARVGARLHQERAAASVNGQITVMDQ